MNKHMQEAIKEAEINENTGFKNGGPFGAVIVKNDTIIAASHNTVIENNDPTAHAEINVIRKAAKILKTHDLSECTLYTTCFPCPMCLSAIAWANIKNIYYGNTKEDAENIGFRDNQIYELINNLNSNKTINFTQIDKEETIKTFNSFKNNSNLY
ncbi:MAG: nucleoside deaminase [Bacilli bacterium]|nr:nucleoside deaminase [Bacilli bacterium]MCI9586265.1 nucleoside deaminase [Bacilli bacterium]